ncbi:MAG TPA: hypothetical protein VKB79_02000 [Bryobacteraceae bacterium]|nr:hypothetical protein [Bryobacteraceae bacterium]
MHHRRSIDFLKDLGAPMAGLRGPKRGDPMDLQQLEKVRGGVSKTLRRPHMSIELLLKHPEAEPKQKFNATCFSTIPIL